MKKNTIKILFSICFILIFSISTLLLIDELYYPLNYEKEIKYYSNLYEIEPELIASVINVESGYDKNAVSRKGAIGLMQIMPSTGEYIAKKIGLNNFKSDNLYDAETNIKIGTYYLSYLNKKFSDINTSLCAYNAGEGTVKLWLGNKTYSSDFKTLSTTPYDETNEYVKKINKSMKRYSKKF